MFLLKYQNLIAQALFLADSLSAIDSAFPRTQYIVAVSILRPVLVAFGSIAALATLIWPVIQHGGQNTES